jgi:hypothetical protein
MRTITLILITITILLLTFGCANSNYLGKSYSPTTNVDLIMDNHDISRDYEVMGNMIVTAGAFTSTEKMQLKLMEQAKLKGADAVLIETYDEVYREITTTTHGSTQPDGHEGKRYNTSTRTNQSKEKILKAKLLKYKD